MVDLVVLIAPLIAGVLSGYFLRERRHINLGKVTLAVIVVLIFSLGFSIGSNSELLNSMPTVGLSALVMSLLAILFSVLFVGLTRRMVQME
jgi:uncharacterized membrane protein YbjE (DUF340 family)